MSDFIKWYKETQQSRDYDVMEAAWILGARMGPYWREPMKDKETALCDLKYPPTCQYKIDGQLSHTVLCGGNDLNSDVKKCPHRWKAKIIVLPREYEP